ncbi:MAG: DUF5916 domain-containing protein, partial [Flavobacteriales bacterium]
MERFNNIYSIFFFALLFIPLNIICQTNQNEMKPVPSLHIDKKKDEIKVNGKLDEETWKKANTANRFYQNFPADTSYAEIKTEVKMSYDKNNLYLAAICHDTTKGDNVIQSLKRDFDMNKSDAFILLLGPFRDKTNGFAFYVNPKGARGEAMIQRGGGFRGTNDAWDNKWFSAVNKLNDKWIVEMRIPFNTLRYKKGQKKWSANFMRNDQKNNRRSSWSAIPRNFNLTAMPYTGNLLFNSPPENNNANVSLIPYTIANLNKDFENDKPYGKEIDAGMDAKVAVSPSLNLDLTVNPDFSQVDVDEQVTNLSRFSIFFPEQRNFFLENKDLFAQFGFSQIRPFFSRKIGLMDTTNGRSRFAQVPILGGARLSGKINNDWRVGLLNAQTEGTVFNKNDSKTRVAPQNYTVATFQRQVMTNSNIAGIFVNRQGFNNTDVNFNDYNRIAGMDFNYTSNNNKWKGKIFYHHSFSPDIKKRNSAHAVWFMRSDRNWLAMWNHEYVGKNYKADVGFVPRVTLSNPKTGDIFRKTYFRIEPIVQYKFYQESSDKINYIKPGTRLSSYYDKNMNTTERELSTSLEIQFLNSSNLEFN